MLKRKKGPCQRAIRRLQEHCIKPTYRPSLSRVLSFHLRPHLQLCVKIIIYSEDSRRAKDSLSQYGKPIHPKVELRTRSLELDYPELCAVSATSSHVFLLVVRVAVVDDSIAGLEQGQSRRPAHCPPPLPAASSRCSRVSQLATSSARDAAAASPCCSLNGYLVTVIDHAGMARP